VRLTVLGGCGAWPAADQAWSGYLVEHDGFRLLLPHFMPNAGLRLEAGGQTLAYTGDTWPSPDLLSLARGADLLLAEASYGREVPGDSADRGFQPTGHDRS
jgi:ribonuclease BN (tRNA processing enzyme)